VDISVAVCLCLYCYKWRTLFPQKPKIRCTESANSSVSKHEAFKICAVWPLLHTRVCAKLEAQIEVVLFCHATCGRPRTPCHTEVGQNVSEAGLGYHRLSWNVNFLPPLDLEENLWRLVAQVFLWFRCPSCHQTNSVKALKETLTKHQ